MARGAIRAVAAVVLVVALGACSVGRSTNQPASAGPTTAGSAVEDYVGSGPKVAVVGDSISWMSAPRIKSALGAAGFAASVTALPSHTTKDMAPYVRSAVATKPRVLVIDLGTNDVLRDSLRMKGYSLADTEGRLLDFKAEAGGACVVVTTVVSHRQPSADLDAATFNASAGRLNGWMRATFPHILDWDAEVWSQRQHGVELLDGTGVHPNETGRKAMGDLVLAATRRCLDRAAS